MYVLFGAIAVAALLAFGSGTAAPPAPACSLSQNTVDYTSNPPRMIFDKCSLPELDGWTPSDSTDEQKVDNQ